MGTGQKEQTEERPGSSWDLYPYPSDSGAPTSSFLSGPALSHLLGPLQEKCLGLWGQVAARQMPWSARALEPQVPS